MASRRPRSRKPPAIDLDRELDEMYSSAITRPNLGFLSVSTSSAPDGGRVPSAVPAAAKSPDTASSVVTSKDRPSMDERSSAVVPSGLQGPYLVTPQIAPTDEESIPGKWKIHHCSTVQDGHNANEQLLYELLWRSAKPVTADERVIQISREDMAAQTRITIRNVKSVLDRLIEKLAVDRVVEPNSFGRIAATYRVFSYRTILDRRRRAGLEWVTRANGVKFISKDLAQAILSRPRFPQSDPSQPAMQSPANSADATPARASLDGASIDAQLPRHTQGASIPLDLGPRLRRVNPAFDSAAVARLWRECRNRIADATADEVVHFADAKASKLRTDKNVRNMIGLLLTSVPEFFDPDTLREFRHERASRVLEEARIIEETRRYWQKVIDDPTATNEDRVMAEQFLRDASS
jgi:hypothetical protein